LKKYRALRKDRARMLTVLGEKQRNGEMPQAETAGKGKAGKK
jgi:hypothetical protein